MTHSDKIFVIDDDRSIRWVLEKALNAVNFPVVSFASAAEALQAIDRAEPAVVVTDIRMPGMDGLQLLQQINERYPQLPDRKSVV